MYKIIKYKQNFESIESTSTKNPQNPKFREKYK